MARWGSADFAQLQKLRNSVEKLQKVDMQRFCEDCARELAARLLALVIPRTPVGKTQREKDAKGKLRAVHMGGALRRGWTAKTEAEAEQRGGGSDGATYAQSLPVTKAGGWYQVTVINPVRYASYVEYGHRQTPGRYVPAIGKQLKKAWVPGQYMLTISEKQLQSIIPSLLERKLQAFLEEAFNGGN